MLEVITSASCSATARVVAGLIEKDLPYELTFITREYKRESQEFASLNPLRKTPVLRHGEAVVYESSIICEYLDEVFPATPLLPVDAVLRAECRDWVYYFDNHVSQRIGKLFDQGGRLVDDADEILFGMFEHVEKSLRSCREDCTFWFGERLGLLDLCAGSVFDAISYVEDRFELKMPESLTQTARWRRNIRSHPSIIQSKEVLAPAP